jgi:hypothetical protein
MSTVYVYGMLLHTYVRILLYICLARGAGVPNPKPAFFFIFFCVRAGLELSEEEAAELFLLVDQDKSGVLTFDEVTRLLEHGAKDFEAHRHIYIYIYIHTHIYMYICVLILPSYYICIRRPLTRAWRQGL